MFIRFEKPKISNAEPMITISKRQMIVLNKQATEKLNVRQNRYAVLFIEKEKRIVGIQLYKKDIKDCYRMSINEVTGQSMIHCSAFFKVYKIIEHGQKSIKKHEDPKIGGILWIIELNNNQ